MEIPIDHVAKLARLGLSKEETKLFAKQLTQILDYANIINKLPTDNVPPTSHPIPIKNVFREDKVISCLNTEDIMKNAPEQEDNMFKVPKILEE